MSPQLSIYALVLIWLLAMAFGLKPEDRSKTRWSEPTSFDFAGSARTTKSGQPISNSPLSIR